MKYLFRILTLLITVGATFFFNACESGDDPKKSEAQTQIDLLVGTWSATAVTHEGNVVTSDFDAFDLTIAQAGTNESMTYAASGRPTDVPSPWDASGTIAFGSPIASKIVLGDGATATYSVSGTTLTVTFTDYSGTGYTGGRVSSATGDWVFTFSK
jgi:hypothetical protein